MVPVSWTEMMCSKTYMKESRKIAKIVAERKNIDTNSNSKS